MHSSRSDTRVGDDSRPASAAIPDRARAFWADFAAYRAPFLSALFLSIASRGQTIVSPLYSIDSYRAAYLPLRVEIAELLLPQGRFGLAVLYWLRDAIGYHGIGVGVSSLLLAVLAFAAAGIFFARLVIDKPTHAEIGIFLAIMTLHPFSTEFFTFSDATLNIMIGLLLAAIGAFLAARATTQGVAIGLGTLLLAASLSIYQTAIAYVLPLCLIALIGRIGSPLGSTRDQPFWQWRETRALIVALASVAVYLAMAHVVSRLAGIPLDGRTDFAGLIDIRTKLAIVWTALGLALWPIPGLVPLFASVLLLALLAVSTALVVAPMLRQGRILSAGLCLALLAAGLCWAVGATAIGKVVWLVPRALAPVSAFAAGLVMIAWRVSPRAFKTMIAMASALLVLAYVGASNRILSDQHRVNLWDAQQANRIVERLERQPRFFEIRALAIIGGDWRRTAPLATTLGDMNISALAAEWARTGLIQEATGYRFATANTTETVLAEQYCKAARSWPDEASVTMIGSVGVVCLPIPK